MPSKHPPTRKKDPPQSPRPAVDVRPQIQCGRLCLESSEGRITRDGQPLKLAPKQFQLLSTLMRHCGEVMPRSLLVREVWRTDYLGDTRMLDVHIRWLRQKIEDDPSDPVYLHTVRGVGYRLDAPPE
jgi:DNA-binding response OmpR family regulator